MGGGGKGGGGGKKGGYQAPNQFGDLSAGQVQGMGLNLPKMNIGNLADRVAGGQLVSGQKIPNYQASNQFRFKQPGSQFRFQDPGKQLRAAPQQAYQGALDVGKENIMRGAQGAFEQANRAMGARGMGRSGLLSGQQAGTARAASGQIADLSRQGAFQQAQDQMAMDKMAAQLGLQTQGMQAGENLSRSGMGLQTQQLQAGENARRAMESLQAKQALTGIQGQELGMLSGLQQAGTQQEMVPFNMMKDLMGMYTGIGFQPAQGAGQGKNPFGDVMQAGGLAASAYCLPKGTQIEVSDGETKSVEDIKVGDQVRGGKVVATTQRLRPDGHSFFEHTFEGDKSVVMSLGHPFLEPFISVKKVSHDSPFTYDLLTENGDYYVNGVRLGSTIR